jgi:hypothetical protein
MPNDRVRPSVAVAVVAWLAVLGAVVAALEWGRAPEPAAPAVVSSRAAAATSASPTEARASRPFDGRVSRPAEEEVPYVPGLVWGEIDLREAQAVMPDNLYWELGAPTTDPDVLEERELEKKRRNEEYGRVLAGDADEEEVRAYYSYRERLSTDYLEFAKWMRERYGDKLSDEFQGMLDLSIKLHTARLAQLPQELEDSLERGREQEKIREEWEREKAEFEEAER